jgi:ATP-binding cassette subfamily B protein
MGGAIPILGALALAAQRLLPLVQQGYAGYASMIGGQGSLRDLLDLLDQQLPTRSAAASPPVVFRARIELRALRFAYSPDGPEIIRGVEIDIPRGARVGFVGTTGSGKSTLLDIIMGFLDPTAGVVMVDGVVMDADLVRSWQSRIAHVPQSIFLTDSTIAENIAFGVPSDAIDMDRVRRAAARAQIAETIEAWPEGYATLVGERGVRLSGGQRQRIGIARALYKQADVLVLDEATSALDAETEEAVMMAIDSLHDELTVLIVAHRLTTLRGCSRIVELVDGRIARTGTYAEIVGGDDAAGRAG